MTTDQKPKQINWSMTISALVAKAGAWITGLVIAADWGGHWYEGAKPILLSVIPLIVAWVAAKGTAKGSLSVKRKPQPTQPVNDEGV